MKAMVITGHGSTEVFRFQEVPEPSIDEYDLLIKVHATSINPVDCKVRQGSKIPRKFPLILGYDVSGTVVAKGERVSNFQINDEVYASPNVFRDGAYAEYVAIDSRSACKKPTSLAHASAAVLPLVSLTAWESLHTRARIQSGQTILIHAGAGGVGHIAIQLAKLHGCKVITTASREESINFCKNILKADYVIDYKRLDFSQVVREITDGKGCPIVIDIVGGTVFEKSMDCLAINGQIVTIVPTITNLISEKLFLKNATLHYEFMGIPTVHNINPEIQSNILQALANLIDSGLLHPCIQTKLQLVDVAEGHKIQESGHILGKISILVD